ncbi:MAG: hypothetical protein C0502_02545 [Opitutus sp.]|nr:hypothetical protein [Opitutus sp.]
MKMRLLFLIALVSGSGSLLAQTPPPAPAPAAPAKETKTAPAPAKADAKEKAKKKEKPKKKEEAKIEGTVFNRPDGTFLGLTLQGGKFKLAFYDKEKKPAKVDVLHAIARWPNVHGPGSNRTVLNTAGDGTFMLSNQFVRGPYAFRLIITLVAGEDGAGTENYAVYFRG